MIHLHAPFEHLPQIRVFHVVVQAPLGGQEFVAPEAFGDVISAFESGSQESQTLLDPYPQRRA
jgi:hypothetical protein